MSFNPDLNVQAQEVTSSKKTKKLNHSTLFFTTSVVTHTKFQEQLGVILDSKLIFDDHFNSVLSTTIKQKDFFVS